MGILAKLRRFMQWPAAAVDPALGDAEGKRLRDLLAKGSWKEASEFLARQTSAKPREFYVEALRQWEGRPDVLDDWTHHGWNDAGAWLVSGAQALLWAWELLPERLLPPGDPRQEDFRERLKQAEKELTRAATLFPDDPTPHAYLIRVGLGLGWSRARAQESWAAALSLDPDHHLAHREFFWHHCARWGGSDKEMFDFARQTSGAMPDANHLHALICDAHLEHWRRRKVEDHDGGADDYWNDPEVKREILAAYDASLGSLRYQDNRLTLNVANVFACCLARIGDKERGVYEFERLQNRMSDYPWSLDGPPVPCFEQLRDKILA